MGLVVDEILDIVDQHVSVTSKADDPDLLGSAVIQQHVTDLLNVPELVMSDGRRREDRMSATQQQFCTFYIQGLLFGVEVETVQEVIRHQEMTGVPLAPAVVAGLINLRGQIVTAIDLRRRLGVRDRHDGELPMNVVVRTDGWRGQPAGGRDRRRRRSGTERFRRGSRHAGQHQPRTHPGGLQAQERAAAGAGHTALREYQRIGRRERAGR